MSRYSALSWVLCSSLVRVVIGRQSGFAGRLASRNPVPHPRLQMLHHPGLLVTRLLGRRRDTQARSRIVREFVFKGPISVSWGVYAAPYNMPTCQHAYRQACYFENPGASLRASGWKTIPSRFRCPYP